MTDLVECPKCGAGFELSDVMRRHLEGEIRAGVQADLQRELDAVQKKLADAQAKEASFLRQRRELEERQQRLALDVEQRVAEETAKSRVQIEQAARERAARDAAEQARIRDAELDDAKRRLAEAAAKEALLLREKRELEDRARDVALEVERRLAAEAERIRGDEARRAEERARAAAKLVDERVQQEREQARLREEELRVQQATLQRTIDDLQRRAHVGSQQLQGEAQEARLKDLLAQAFPQDRIEEVAKGTTGADVLQRVVVDGRDCGTIIWESKRTKAWADDWLSKLRDDQRAAGAACAVIVSQALPSDVKRFGARDGVWVAGWEYATALATVLRAGLVDVAAARRSSEGRGEKMQMLYAYLTGPEFKNRVGGLIEAFTQMQSDLAAEKRAMASIWSRREKQMQRALENVGAFYGDLQGIAGAGLDDLPQLALAAVAGMPLPEPDEANDSTPPVSAPRPDDAQLADYLLSLVPHDGATVGDHALCALFVERALTERGVQVSQVDYERLKARLVVDGALKKAKRGGTIARQARTGTLL